MSLEKAVDARARLGERGSPALERLAAGIGQLVGALRGAGDGLVPLAADEALLLEPAQDAVEVADVDPLVAEQGGQPLEQVVAVGGTLAEEEQQGGDLKSLDPPAPSMPSASSIHM